jgi:protocatechuate 3,4-dioxygenase beta subunit
VRSRNHADRLAAGRSPEERWLELNLADSRVSRRELLAKCVALGSLTVVASLAPSAALEAWESQLSRAPTAWNELGPFYRKGAPSRRQLRAPGDRGLPLAVTGRIFDTRGDTVPDATLEIWHTNDRGQYDLSGYRYRTSLATDGSGAYGFDSIVPGHYPARVCQHIHYLVRAPGHRVLTTQLYFATDPVFDGDPDRNYTKDPLIRSRELVRPVVLAGALGNVTAAVSFEIVMERA